MKRIITLLLSALMVVTLGTVNVFGDGNVAKIGDAEYATLADAIIKGVPTDGTKTTITMIADEVLTEEITIDEGKKIVLDLNGKTISNCEIGFNFTTTKSSKGSIPARFTIIVEGELEVKDNGSNGKINIQSYSYGTTKALLVKNNGKVVVTSGYIYGEYAAFYVVGNTNLPHKKRLKYQH